jgi:hypothetical protein
MRRIVFRGTTSPVRERRNPAIEGVVPSAA